MRKKILKSALLTLLFSLLLSVNVFAAGLTQDAAGIHYLNDDGTYAVSTWVEISNLWFLFDANGVCVNPTGALAPNDADGCYQVVTSYTPFVTEDAALLNQCLTNGTVVNLEGQYFITPQAATVMRNANRAASDTTVTQNEQLIEEETVVEEQTEIYVYITATGKKYHAINNCGNTNPQNTRYVTIEYAKQRGLGACSKCY
ncbi:hypothetical protein FMM75_05465 [Lachnospiraceae bacterium MD335]|jgi:hypothetical protein|nr:hypothetical protein [Lachnospiraceae bacterium MD335]